MKKYRPSILMAALAVVCLVAHFVLGWWADLTDASQHGIMTTIAEYRIEWGRDVFENLQSELIQLAIQFAILAGILAKFGIIAYEQDIEEIKEMLRAMKNDIKSSAESEKEIAEFDRRLNVIEYSIAEQVNP